MLSPHRPRWHAGTMSILSLAHACIKTTSLEQTASFYCDALGMKKLFEFTRAGKPIGMYLKGENDSFIEVFLASEVASIDSRCLNHFCLETDDIKALHERVADNGYKPGDIKMGSDNSWQFWVKDPNGMDLEFHQYTPESAQFTGENVEVDW